MINTGLSIFYNFICILLAIYVKSLFDAEYKGKKLSLHNFFVKIWQKSMKHPLIVISIVGIYFWMFYAVFFSGNPSFSPQLKNYVYQLFESWGNKIYGQLFSGETIVSEIVLFFVLVTTVLNLYVSLYYILFYPLLFSIKWLKKIYSLFKKIPYQIPEIVSDLRIKMPIVWFVISTISVIYLFANRSKISDNDINFFVTNIVIVVVYLLQRIRFFYMWLFDKYKQIKPNRIQKLRKESYRTKTNRIIRKLEKEKKNNG